MTSILFKKCISSITILIITTLLFSCSSTKKISKIEISPLSTSKLLRKIEKNAPDFRTFNSKLSVVATDNGEKNSFKAQLKIKNEECIILNVNKLALQIAKIYVDPDSAKFVNYFNRDYYSDKIESFQKYLKIAANYTTLQSLLTADITQTINEFGLEKNLTTLIDSNMYCMKNSLKSSIEKALSKGQESKMERYMNRMDDADFITYSIWIDPNEYTPKKIALFDLKTKSSLTINYSDFQKIDRKYYPQEIHIYYSISNEKTEVEIKMTKPILDKEKEFNFTIPISYERLKLPKR